MAKLSSRRRRSMPKSDFAGPGHSFPDNDPVHARLAISGATRSEHAGNISPSTEARIKAEARAKLKEYNGNGRTDHTAKGRAGLRRTYVGK